jgi:hypothetical protein
MRMIRRTLVVGIFLTATSGFASQLAQYISVAQGQDYILTNLGTSETLVSNVDVPIMFFWAAGLGLPAGPINAKLNFSATTTTHATTDGSGNISEQSWSGTFSILSLTNQNLLSGTFGPSGLFVGAGTSAGFTDSAPPSTEVVFSSDFLIFTNTLQRGITFSFSNFQVGGSSANLSINANGFDNSGNYAGSGGFASTPLPLVIPEPSSMALIGTGLIGLAMVLRRRKA